MDQVQLEALSLQELRELHQSIDTAIRAAIRARAQAKANPVRPAAAAANAPRDLERERDAWMAARSKPRPL